MDNGHRPLGGMSNLTTWTHLSQYMRVSVVGARQVWSAPVARLVAPNGFGEASWQDETPDTFIALRLSGATVRQARGPCVGTTSRTGGCFVLQVRGARSGFVTDGWSETAHISLNADLLDRAAALAGQPRLSGRLRPDIVFPERQTELDAMIRLYVCRAIDERNPPTPLEMEARILHILDGILNLHGTRLCKQKMRGGLTDCQIRRVMDYIDAHLSEELYIDTLASVAQCGEKHFPRAFRQSTGLSPHRWLVQRRIDRAKARLASTSMSIAEIALETGFVDQSHFTHVFRKSSGLTPAAYRRDSKL